MQTVRLLCALLLAFTISSCYGNRHKSIAQVTYSAAMAESGDTLQQGEGIFSIDGDSVSTLKRPYSINYNFVVWADSVTLFSQQPEEILSQLPADSFSVKHDSLLVVADVRVVPADTIDSVWVQLATEQARFGWIHESELLPRVAPDDPISQFIAAFSSTLRMALLVVLSAFGIIVAMSLLRRKNAHIVHFNDTDSFYPLLLCLLTAWAAIIYADLQHHALAQWQYFYFHPTLNPFATHRPLSLFLGVLWAMLIVGLAAADDVRRKLSFGEWVVYMISLAAVCLLLYLIFSLASLYGVGYLLLALYVAAAIWQYVRRAKNRYVCGKCGKPLQHKGICPHCGANNV